MKGLIEVAPRTWVNPDYIAWIYETSLHRVVLHMSDGTTIDTEKSFEKIDEMIKSVVAYG